MDFRKLVLLIGALAVAAVTAIMAKNMFSGAGAPKAAAKSAVKKGPEVLVATRGLPIGTIIDAEALKYQMWPEGLVQPAYFVKGEKGLNPADLIGTVVRNEITAGQPLTQGQLIKPGDRGFLAAALGPGMRAITVSVSDTSSVAGFVFPGDRVDLMLTQQVGGEGESLKVSETILKNVRVLATDRRTAAVNQEGKAVAKSVSLVTLEVTPKIAEKIAVAQTIGQLSLSLRSIADNTQELERAIASGEIDLPETDDPIAERRMLLAIANKPVDNGSTYTVGSEVSRFERSSVPSKGSKPSAEPADAMTRMMGSIVNLAASRAVTAPAEAQPARPTGQVVRVARGNNVTVVPVGAK